MTSEFLDTEGGMLILLTEYRHALYDIAPETAERMGLTQAAAVANVRVLRARTSLLAEDSRVADRLLEFCSGRPRRAVRGGLPDPPT